MLPALTPAQLAGLSDDVLARWADGYANSFNAQALAQVQAEPGRRAAARQLVAA